MYLLFSHLMSPSETESAKAGVFKTCSSPNNKYDILFTIYLKFICCFSYRELRLSENSGIDQMTVYWMNYKAITCEK